MFVVTRRADETTQLLIVKKKISSCFVFFVFFSGLNFHHVCYHDDYVRILITYCVSLKGKKYLLWLIWN